MKNFNTITKWQVKNMFDALAPTDESVRSKIFVGRTQELEGIVTDISSINRAIQVYGSYGIGKTMLIRETLLRLEQLPDIEFITAYTNYDPNFGFKNCALMAIADRLSDEFGNEEATRISRLLEEQNRASASVMDKWLTRLKSESEKSKPGCRIVVAVDDIERRTDVALIPKIIDDIRSLRNAGYSVIIPGHPMNATNALSTQSSGMLVRVELKQLEIPDLIDVIKKHLELGYIKQGRPELYPFVPETAQLIAERFSKPNNTVREFVVACFHILNRAVQICDEYIEPKDLDLIWPAITKEILSAVETEDHAWHILQIIREQGGEIDEDMDYDVIEHILDYPGGYEDVVGKVIELVNNSILVHDHDGHKLSIKMNQTLDRKTLNAILDANTNTFAKEQNGKS